MPCRIGSFGRYFFVFFFYFSSNMFGWLLLSFSESMLTTNVWKENVFQWTRAHNWKCIIHIISKGLLYIYLFMDALLLLLLSYTYVVIWVHETECCIYVYIVVCRMPFDKFFRFILKYISIIFFSVFFGWKGRARCLICIFIICSFFSLLLFS